MERDVKMFNLMQPLEDHLADFVTRMNGGLKLILQAELMIKKFQEETGVQKPSLAEMQRIMVAYDDIRVCLLCSI
jgi:hypothetical protein